MLNTLNLSAAATLGPALYDYAGKASSNSAPTGSIGAMNADAQTRGGMCFCQKTPHGSLYVTASSCTPGYGPKCTYSNVHTLCDCIKRTCGDCDGGNGCNSAGTCSGKKVGKSCLGGTCHLVKDCGKYNTTACCGCS